MGVMALARSFEFNAVKTLSLLLGALSRLLGWLASLKLLGFLESLGFRDVLLGWPAALKLLSLAEMLRLGQMLLRTLWLSVAGLLVNVNFLTVLGRLLGRLRMTAMLFFEDANLFLDVGVVRMRRRRRMKGGGKGFVRLFVTFPSV